MDPSSGATAPMLYPTPSKAALQLQYIGKTIADAQAPAAVIDVAVVRRNCKLMLDAVGKLGVDFRAHVKTHKVCIGIISRRHQDYVLTTRDLDDGDREAPSRGALQVREAHLLDCVRDGESAALAIGP